MLPVFYVVRGFKVLSTRPKIKEKVKGIHEVSENDFKYMKDLRNALGINHL